jgi:hypothetical protein
VTGRDRLRRALGTERLLPTAPAPPRQQPEPRNDGRQALAHMGLCARFRPQ